MIYRTTDLRSNEFRKLDGGAEFEVVEANPMIGYRGCYRYLHDPEVFQLELRALARAREASPNLHLMLPFVRTPWELEACLEAIDLSPLGHQRGFAALDHGRGAIRSSSTSPPTPPWGSTGSRSAPTT